MSELKKWCEGVHCNLRQTQEMIVAGMLSFVKKLYLLVDGKFPFSVVDHMHHGRVEWSSDSCGCR